MRTLVTIDRKGEVMTTFSQTPGAGVSPRLNPAPGNPEFTSEQIAQWRHQINELNHPVIVLNAQFQPVLLNESLRAKLSEPSTLPGTTQPTAFLWQSICETASRIAAEHARSSGDMTIGQAFPINQRCFGAIGSVIKSPSGQIQGAVLSLADLGASAAGLREFFTTGLQSLKQLADETVDETVRGQIGLDCVLPLIVLDHLFVPWPCRVKCQL